MTLWNLKNKTDDTPRVTILMAALCLIVFAVLQVKGEPGSWDLYSRFGYLPAAAIYRGAWTAVISSAFFHLEIWHVGFNVYWLWHLGGRMEREIGSIRFILFYLSAAIVSSAAELALHGDTGIGASGAIYAVFGFMWLAKGRYPRFREILDDRTIRWFVIWLIGCYIGTYLKVLNIGNEAHLFGLLFGAAVAAAWLIPARRIIGLLSSIALIASAAVSLFWAPWSVEWLSVKAYALHEKGQYARAIELYTRIIEKDPTDAWAMTNRSLVYTAMGKQAEADADSRRAESIEMARERKK